MKKITNFLLFFFLFSSLNIDACPCGCGSMSPLYLAPSEFAKAQMAFLREYNDFHIGANGEKGKEDSPQYSDVMSLGYAQRLSSKFVLSALAPIRRNSYERQSSGASLGDPLMTLRFQMLPINIASPGIPAMDFFTSYKFPYGRSMDDGVSKPHSLNIHSNGLQELRAGMSFWWQVKEITIGVEDSFMYALEKDKKRGDEPYQFSQGLGQNYGITTSYTFFGSGQIFALYEGEQKGPDRADGTLTEDSERLRNSYGGGGNLRVGVGKTLGLTLKKGGAIFQNKNTTHTTGWTISYEQTFF